MSTKTTSLSRNHIGNEFDYSAYSKNMRLALSNEDIVTSQGDINHEYFLMKKGTFWSEKHQKALIRALQIFGIFSPLFFFIFILLDFCLKRSGKLAKDQIL